MKRYEKNEAGGSDELKNEVFDDDKVKNKANLYKM